MTQNIHIRFIGSADFGQAQKAIKGVTGEVAALSAAVQSAATAGGSKSIADTRWLDNFKKSVASQRSLMQSSIMGLNDFGVKSVKVADHVDTLTEKIRAQKFGVGDLIKEHKSLSSVYRQQMANQKAMVMEWSRNGDGSINADVITRNRNAAEFGKSIKNWRSEMGMYNQVLGSVADNTVKWGKNTQWAGRQMTAGLSMPLIAAAAGAGAMAYQIDKGLTAIVKVYGDASTALTTTDAEIKAASMTTAKVLADTYGQSAKDSLEITAQLAATGKTGVELQQSTMAVSKARLLGELDVQDAMKATITLQSVYGMSSKELGDSFNYMNSMENQTSLTMQDFVVGIPKVTGVIKELGGGIKETGVLLAAMKIAGIDAAEGANAIKSIAFKTSAQGNGAKTMFQKLTGQTYESVVGQTTDVTERLIKVGTAMKDLNPTDRVGLIAKMFGLYQGSKALSIIDQLTNGSEQMARAIDVSKQSLEQWGATADRELSKLTGSKWNQFQQAWQSLKINIAEFGQQFLVMALPVLNWFDGLVKAFNNLSGPMKNILTWAGLIAAAFGPIVMFAGLMGNMVGSIGKLSSFVIGLVAPFRMLTTEQIAEQKLSRLAKKTTNDEAAAYGILAVQIREATMALQGLAEKQMAKQGLPLAGASYGTPLAAGHIGPTGPVGTASTASSEIEKNAGKTAKSWRNISASTGAFAVAGVAAMASMTTDSNTMAGHIADSAFLIASLGPLMTNLPFQRMGARLKSALATAITPLTFFSGKDGAARNMLGPATQGRMSKIAEGTKSGVSKMTSSLKSLIPTIASIGTAFAGIALVAGGAIYAMNESVKKSRENMAAFGDSAKTYAEVLGFTFTEVGQKVDEAGVAVETLDQKVQKFAESNTGATNVLQQFSNAGDAKQQQEAIGEGLKAALHGATPEAATEAAKIAWRIMNKTIGEKEMTARIKATIDFGDMDAVIAAKINDIQNKIGDAASGRLKVGWAETISRWMGQDNGLSVAGEQAVKNQAKDMLDLLNSSTADNLPTMIQQFQEAGTKADNAFFNSMFNEKQKKELADKGINTMKDLQSAMAKEIKNADTGPFASSKNPLENILPTITDQQIEQFTSNADARMQIVRDIADADKSLTDEQRNSIKYSGDAVTMLNKYLEITGRLKEPTTSAAKALADWNAWQERAAKSGAAWSDAEKLARLNIFRTAAGLPKATNYLQGFALEAYKAADALQYLSTKKLPTAVQQAGGGFSSDMTYSESDTIVSDLQSTYSSAMDTIYNGAAQASDDMMQAQMAGIASRYDTLRNGLDAQQKAAEKSFDSQVKKFDYAWEDKMDKWTKKWDKRKAATEATYDRQIDKIKAQIKAEEDAEAIRQKIFEAEKTRMSRLAEMQNKNIDLNAALRTGNVDEAAKISNDMASTNTGWALTDAAAAGSDAADKRKAALEAKVTTLEKKKTDALKAMDDLEAAERKMLDRQKDREKELLDARRQAMEDTYAARKKSLDKQEADEKANTERSIARRKAALEAELAALKAFVPRDQAELNAHVAKIEAAYGRFGTDLTKSGKGWAGTVGSALTNSMEVTRAKEANTTSWQALGRVIAENMSKGSFNMTLSQFIKWISTGEMPAGAGVGYTGKNARAVKDGKGGVKWQYGAQGGIPSGAHSGAIIGKNDNSRTGYTGSMSPSERWTRTLTGEAVLNRRATRNLGEDWINATNSHGTPPPMGGPTSGDANISSALALAPMTVAFRNAIGFMGAKRQQQDAAAAEASQTSGSVSSAVDASAIYPGGWVRPAQGPITSPYGWRIHPTLHYRKLHTGTDIGAPYGAPIRAAKGGTVTFAGDGQSYGNHTVIRHGGGLATTYSHQSQFAIQPGQKVSTGQRIGNVGATGRVTGAHLHFEYLRGGKFHNPNEIIPGLDTGGFVVKDGLAKLHKKETVLTRPLSAKLDEGINQIAEGPETHVTNNFTFTGNINGIDDLERAMIKVNEKINKRTGVARKVGTRN